jgi:hypothetical protein
MKSLAGQGAALGLVCMLSSGCYDWVLIKPVEMPKLNGSFASPVGQVGPRTVVAVRVVDVEREDGTLAEIQGNFDLKVIRKGGEEISFEHPVEAERQGEEFVIRGGNRAATRIPLSDIEHAEVSQLSPGKTAVAITIPVVLGTALAIAVPLVLVSSRH